MSDRCSICNSFPVFCSCNTEATTKESEVVGNITFSPEARMDIQRVAANSVIDELNTELKAALSLLEESEWSYSGHVMGDNFPVAQPCCFICKSSKKKGHTKDCKIAKALGR